MQIKTAILLALPFVYSSAIMADGFERTILIEEFTTEKCHNCPEAATDLDNLLKKLNTETTDKAVVMAHHSGFYSDWLTSAESLELLWLFNSNGSTYAPGFMIDRSVFEDEISPVFANYNNGELLEQRVRESFERPAECKLTASCFYNENNLTAQIIIDGERLTENVLEDARISVYLTENLIPQRHQEGGGEEYVHNHVSRKSNATWGEPIDWKGLKFKYEYQFDIEDNFNVENLEIVAFVNNYNETDPLLCSISNTTSIPVKNISGIISSENDPISENFIYSDGRIVDLDGTPCEVYGLDGYKIRNYNLPQGIYIAHLRDTIKKIVVRN